MSTRRQFLKTLSLSGFALAHPSYVFAAESSPFSGRLVITLQAVGGWDVTYFCDPKENRQGSDVITNWSKSDQTRTAGNLIFAPVARNRAFFEKHYAKTLVLNGIDAQTNAHGIGESANWSGRTAAGYPTLTALYSAVHAPQLPMSYISFGGFNKTANLLRPAVMPYSTSELSTLLRPNTTQGGLLLDSKIWDLIRQMHASDAQSMLEDEALIAGSRRARTAYLESLSKNAALADFAATLPTSQQEAQIGGGNRLIIQVHFALLAFKAGVSATADLIEGGLDTHADNDARQVTSLGKVTDALDYLWQFAEELGLANRLTVIVGSDFSRTPFYNSGAGKDHWPIGSYLVMQKNAAFTNRTIGKTDEEQNALFLNPTTLQSSSLSGIKLLPAHVQKALRKHLGLETAVVTQAFPFVNTETIGFFPR
ncbi:MAG: DUF1501 domain-containing protein [Gammaproteobacteria bacterium]|nr:DUF1501 domain-containing protein [Gammaproteobacteria bacterium]